MLVYALDRVSKYAVTQNLHIGQTADLIGTVLQLHYVENSGAAFSLGSGTTWLFAIIAAVVAVFIIVFARRIRSRAWAVLFGLLLGGTLGNLTDRLTRGESFGSGHVIDFIQVIYFPAIFNIADSAIVAAMGLFIILTIRGVGLDGQRAKREPAAKPAATDPS
ncbi:signal peptidase II [soil metagenome]